MKQEFKYNENRNNCIYLVHLELQTWQISESMCFAEARESAVLSKSSVHIFIRTTCPALDVIILKKTTHIMINRKLKKKESECRRQMVNRTGLCSWTTVFPIIY